VVGLPLRTTLKLIEKVMVPEEDDDDGGLFVDSREEEEGYHAE
jgi:septum formation protein